jgi:hypothetical protein
MGDAPRHPIARAEANPYFSILCNYLFIFEYFAGNVAK